MSEAQRWFRHLNRDPFKWLLWGSVLAIAVMLLLPVRDRLDEAHVALTFLLIVLAGSAHGGRLLGVLLSFAAFFSFDWFFLPPYTTLAVRDPLDWLVLIAFLVTSLSAAQLLYVARARRDALERANALSEADQLKNALLASVSHDLRTPLTTIKGLAHEMSASGDERAIIIEDEADRLSRMVGDLLDSATLNAGAFHPDIQMNAVDDLIGSAIQQFSGRSDKDRIIAALDRPDDLLIGHFDFIHTLRIITNLLDNALKYAPADTPVELRAGRDGNMISIRVADRGPGLPSHEPSRMFEPFYRPHGVVADSRSTGLGLSIARQLAEIQKGTLECTERTEGGSVFTLRLPSAQ